MKLVLVAGLNPKLQQQGPTIRLYEGRWKLTTEHQKDSVLMLCSVSSPEIPPVLAKDGYEFNSFGESFALRVSEIGTEEFINVFAEVINGPVPSTTT